MRGMVTLVRGLSRVYAHVKGFAGMISENIINKVIESSDIVDVVGAFVTLKKRGVRYYGLCPFHEDRHLGNFVVYPAKQCYKCFSCGAKGGAAKFLMEKEGLSFPDAIRWLGKRKGIDVDDRSVDIEVKKLEPPPPLPTLFLPEVFVAKRQHISDNVLCVWLRSLPWSQQQAERLEDVLKMYKVGRAKWSPAHTLFWQIDENGGVRDGKVMKYLPDGHRDKEDRYSVTWVSRRLFNAKRYDEDKWEVRRCLFGLHLLDEYKDAEVHVVESEKTAIFCATYFGDPEHHLWMATAGKDNLCRALLDPLIRSRRIIALHPDKDGVENWEHKCQEIGYRFAYVNNRIMHRYWKEQDGPKADIADVLIRVMEDELRDCLTKKLADILPEVNPAVKLLIDNLKLENQ